MRQKINSAIHIALTIALGGWLAIAGNAADFRVNSSADDQNDGCGAAPNTCTLREAVNAANLAAGLDTVTFDAAVGTVFLTSEIAITDAVSFQPSAPNTLAAVRGAAGGSRIFNISANTTINRLSLTNANAGSSNGGAIINNGATLTINESVITNNSTDGNGGGIYTLGGTVNVNRSTIGGTGAGGQNIAANGGGIYNENGTVNLINSTITGNTASNIGGGYYGFANLGAAILSSNSSTIAFNTATSGGGIAVSSTLSFTSLATITNTIVSNNTATTGSDLNGNPLVGGTPGTITSGGYNIIRMTAGATIIATTGDQFNTDPLLLPLQPNGGLTPTHGLQLSPASPAIDKGNSNQTVDQRGFTRDDDFPSIPNAANGTDIGAFEAQIGATASSVNIVGRVLSVTGRGISGAVVNLTDPNGTARRALTNPFGIYRFLNVPSGATYILHARAKNRGFNPRVISAVSDTTVDFQEEPQISH